MRYRKLGASGLRVSEIGFGAWGIGGARRAASDLPSFKKSQLVQIEKIYRNNTFFLVAKGEK